MFNTDDLLLILDCVVRRVCQLNDEIPRQPKQIAEVEDLRLKIISQIKKDIGAKG